MKLPKPVVLSLSWFVTPYHRLSTLVPPQAKFNWQLHWFSNFLHCDSCGKVSWACDAPAAI